MVNDKYVEEAAEVMEMVTLGASAASQNVLES